MILGMSNTYQQLATALRYDEIRYALKKRGDSRVGTNSPFAIQDKKTKKVQSWLSWVLLISTSMVGPDCTCFTIPRMLIKDTEASALSCELSGRHFFLSDPPPKHPLQGSHHGHHR